MLDDFVGALARELEIDELPKTEVAGVYAIPLDEGISVLIAPLPTEGFCLSCTIDDCPTENKEALFTHMMTSNLFGEGTKGATLGLDEAAKRITLTRNIDYVVDEERFLEVVEDFLNTIELWEEEIKEHQSQLS